MATKKKKEPMLKLPSRKDLLKALYETTRYHTRGSLRSGMTEEHYKKCLEECGVLDSASALYEISGRDERFFGELCQTATPESRLGKSLCAMGKKLLVESDAYQKQYDDDYRKVEQQLKFGVISIKKAQALIEGFVKKYSR